MVSDGDNDSGVDESTQGNVSKHSSELKVKIILFVDF